MPSIGTYIPDWLRHPSERFLRFFYSLLAVISLAVNIGHMSNLVEFTYMHSDECLWETRRVATRYEMYITEILEGGRADEAGLREGDRVIAINRVEIADHPRNTFIAQEILNESPVDTPIPYVVERDGQVLSLTISLAENINYIPWVFLAFSLIWLVIGHIVVMTQPRGRVQRRFFFAAVTVTYAFIFPAALLQAKVGSIAVLAWSVLRFGFFLCWLRFCMTFPVDQDVLKTTGRKIAYYSPLIIVAALGLLTESVIPMNIVSIIFGLVYLATSVLYFGGGIFFLFRGRAMLPRNADRRPVTVIVAGAVIAAVTITYLTVIQTTVKEALILNPQLLLPIVLVLALPLSFGYAIFKYQVMDFRPFVRATVVYGATMVLVGGLYLAIGYGIGQIFGALIGKELEAPVEVFIFVVFVLLFDPLKRKLQTAVENRFFPQHRDYSAELAAYSEEIAETVGTSAVAGLIARTLKETLHLRSVCVAMERGEEKELTIVAGEPELIGKKIGDSSENLRQLLVQSHALNSLETAGAPFAGLVSTFSYVAGLYAQGRITGVVLLSRPSDGEALSGSQTPFIASVVMQGASALEVARLYEEELARQRYQEELATARRIQESLLPSVMPDFPGISISAVSQPAQTVGGDYYEVIRLDDRRFLVMIADVSGKGLPASLYMAELHGMVRIASAIHDTPKEMLVMLNNHLHQVIERGSFITATLLLFDTVRKTVSYARAGHTPIVRRTGTKVDTLIPTGLPLGVRSELFDPYLQQYTVTYEPGETLILYSDGVSEAMNSRREEFGDGRLLDVISGSPDTSSDSICSSILRRVEEFRAGAEPNDDVTIVVVRIEREVLHAHTPARPVENLVRE